VCSWTHSDYVAAPDFEPWLLAIFISVRSRSSEPRSLRLRKNCVRRPEVRSAFTPRFLSNHFNLVLPGSLFGSQLSLILDLDAGEIDPVVVRHYNNDIVLVLLVVDGWIRDCCGRKTLGLVGGAGALNASHGDR
jgi:hypothetical protein